MNAVLAKIAAADRVLARVVRSIRRTGGILLRQVYVGFHMLRTSLACLRGASSAIKGDEVSRGRLALLPALSYDIVMKSLTIRLPDEMAERLEQESRNRGVSKSDLVRERLSQAAQSHALERSVSDILEAAWETRASARRRQFRSSHKRRIADAIRAKKLPR